MKLTARSTTNQLSDRRQEATPRSTMYGKLMDSRSKSAAYFQRTNANRPTFCGEKSGNRVFGC